MPKFQTGYKLINDEDHVDLDAENVVDYRLHRASDRSKWHHIEDLDGFFTRVYKYHQLNGWKCIFWDNILQPVVIAFYIFFFCFVYACINYPVMFGDKKPAHYNESTRIELIDTIYDSETCKSHISESRTLILILIVAICCFCFGIAKAIFRLLSYNEIFKFYEEALHVKEASLKTLKWEDIQEKLKLVQDEYQMCINKQQMNEFDIQSRILRHQNYYVAMVNKGVLVPTFNVPFVGQWKYWSNFLKWNMNILFFTGPFAFFDKSYHLKDVYKRTNNRDKLENDFKKYITIIAIFELIMCPFFILFGFIYAVYSLVGEAKYNPEKISLRMWSLYSKEYLRHFNELEHQFKSRLCNAYKPATRYMRILNDNVMTVFINKFYAIVVVIVGYMALLSYWDADVVEINHFFTLLVTCIVLLKVFDSVKKDEYDASNPELELRAVISHVHYAPASWRNRACEDDVKYQFSDLFQMKITYVIEQLLSPVLTPLILLLWVRPRAGEFIDFFHNFTVSVEGIGDVCSFATLDVKKHGDPMWHSNNYDEEKNKIQNKSYLYSHNNKTANNGKTELSILQFAISNRNWKPENEERNFLVDWETNAAQMATGHDAPPHPITTSYDNIYPSLPMEFTSCEMTASYVNQRNNLRKKVNTPRHSLADTNSVYHSIMNSPQKQIQMEMSANALLMHDRHQQRLMRREGVQVFTPLTEETPLNAGFYGNESTSYQKATTSTDTIMQVVQSPGDKSVHNITMLSDDGLSDDLPPENFEVDDFGSNVENRML